MGRSRLAASHLAAGGAAASAQRLRTRARRRRPLAVLRVLSTSACARPQTPDPPELRALPLGLTVRSRQTASGRTGKFRVRHSRPGSGTHAPRRRSWRSPEGLRVPGKEKPGPHQNDDKPPSAKAPPASASPPTPWAVLPRNRGGLWVSGRLAELEGKEVGAEPAGLRGTAETTIPSRQPGRRREPRRSSRRVLRARQGWNVARVGGSRCWGLEPQALHRRAPTRESGRLAALQLMHAFKTPEPVDAMHR